VRTTFEIKFLESNLEEAKNKAISKISKFLSISPEDFDNLVSLELKVLTIEDELSADTDLFEVVAYASLKSSITRF
jgi:hypothetical protein